MIYSDTNLQGAWRPEEWFQNMDGTMPNLQASAVGTPMALAIHFYTHMSPT